MIQGFFALATTNRSSFLLTSVVSIAALCFSLASRSSFAAPPVNSPLLAKQTFEFTLPTADGGTFKLTSKSPAALRVICFLGCECPLALQYGPRLQEMAERYTPQGVQFLGVNSNPQDSLADVQKYVEKLGLTFPVLKDHDRVVAAKLEATRTPEVIVLSPEGFPLYRGRIDDQYQPGIVRNRSSRDDLKIAIEEALAGKSISVPNTQAFGCLIAKPREQATDSSVTYCGQIAKLIQRHCLECHRAGEIGPFALDQYDQVVGWADMMLETVEQQRMPPWNANPEHGEFINARGMPESDRKLLAQWVASGTPYGNPDELPSDLISTAESPEGTKADFSIAMSDQPFAIPAEGTLDYQYFVVDPKFDEERWVNFAEVIPGDRSVVHHAIVFIRPPDGQRLDGVGWLTAYVPGQQVPRSPRNLARRLPAGSKLVFQMHYTPNGKATSDLTRLNLSFSSESEVTEELVTLISINQELEIPPQMANVPVEASTDRLPQDGKLLALAPHMHLRGKSMRVHTITAEDEQKVILDVPNYDFNWQHTYILKDPLPLANLKKFSFIATFDNSKNNPFNPDPDDFVTWGDQTWEEMAIVFYEVAKPLVKPTVMKEQQPLVQDEPPVLPRHEALADAYLKELDRNQDGKLSYDEVERAVQLQGFRNLDRNGDRIIERSELIEVLRQSR